MGGGINGFILQQRLAKEFVLGQLETQLCSRWIMASCVRGLILVSLEKKQASMAQLTGCIREGLIEKEIFGLRYSQGPTYTSRGENATTPSQRGSSTCKGVACWRNREKPHSVHVSWSKGGRAVRVECGRQASARPQDLAGQGMRSCFLSSGHREFFVLN